MRGDIKYYCEVGLINYRISLTMKACVVLLTNTDSKAVSRSNTQSQSVAQAQEPIGKWTAAQSDLPNDKAKRRTTAQPKHRNRLCLEMKVRTQPRRALY